MKNTEYALGIVVYTGHDTKLMKNQGACRNKKSHIEKQLNKYILGVFVVQLIMCLVLTILAVVFRVTFYSSSVNSQLSPRIMIQDLQPVMAVQEFIICSQIILNNMAHLLVDLSLLLLSLCSLIQ